jgi:hypothetical protein
MHSIGNYALAHGEIDPKSLSQEQKRIYVRTSYTLMFRQRVKNKASFYLFFQRKKV